MAVATQAQIWSYELHRDICLSLGIPQSTLAHKKLKGTVTTQSATGNYIYKGPGPVTTYVPEYVSQILVWWVNMTFIRGEQRREDQTPAVLAVEEVQGQFPAIDDNGNTLIVAEDDHIIDSQTGWIYRINNPVISPDGGFYTCINERQR